MAGRGKAAHHPAGGEEPASNPPLWTADRDFGRFTGLAQYNPLARLGHPVPLTPLIAVSTPDARFTSA